MKPVAEFNIHLPWVVVVKSSERQAVVQQDAAIRHIQCGYGKAVFFTEALPER
jgi:hypothetical protein